MKADSIYIIAEAGVNHNGSLDLAKELVKAAFEAGADAVKFQTFQASQVVSIHAPKADYQLKTTAEEESQLEMIKKLELDEAMHRKISSECHDRGIEFLSTPFDLQSVDLLTALNVSKLKIGSGDVSNAMLLLKASQTGKDIILSTGMSTLKEIEQALGVIAFGYLYLNTGPAPCLNSFNEVYNSEQGQACLREKVALLHCTTEYPAPFEDVNLRAMDTLKSTFGLKVGYSDHTRGIAVPIAAAAMGAQVIEKHFTLDRDLPGPDHKASLEPDELKSMVESIRQVEKVMGSGDKKPAPAELKNIPIARRSLVALKRITEGEVFTIDNLGAKRPGTGISAIYYYDWLGKAAQRNYEPDELLVP